MSEIQLTTYYRCRLRLIILNRQQIYKRHHAALHLFAVYKRTYQQPKHIKLPVTESNLRNHRMLLIWAESAAT